MNFNITSQGAEILNGIMSGIDSLVKSLSNEYPSVSTKINELTDILVDTFDGGSDTNLKVFSSFLAKSCALAYFQKLDNDKNLSKLKEENKYDTDFSFGFSGLSELVTATIDSIKHNKNNEDSINSVIESNLLSNIRDIDVSSYLSDGFVDKDINLIALLGEKEKVEINKSILDLIKTNNAYMTANKEAVDQILETYRLLFQDSFGLSPYIGVVATKTNPPLRVIKENYRRGSIPTANTTFGIIADFLSGKTYTEGTSNRVMYDVDEVDDRQFDVKDIMFNHDKPVYYPNKILEYALGRELTYNLSEQIYKPYAKTDSWEDYEEGYVKEQVKDLVLRGIYYSLEHNFSFSDLKKYCGYTGEVIDSKDLFSNEDFLRVISDENEFMVISRYLATPRIQEKVAKDLNQLVASLCTGCCVTKYNALNNTCNSIAIRLVDVGGKFNESMTRDIFGKLVLKSETVDFADGFSIETKNPSISLPYKIYEFRHEFDAALAGAEPLFGYTAVELYKRRGIKLGWSKILLGEDIKGTPLFAGANRINGELPIQAEHFVHNMMAGSRSGKGVMTMNIVASGLAEHKPIFYLDRKPDMAVLFAELSQGSMFIVNGGQVEDGNDPRGLFNEVSGKMVSGWEQGYNNMPSYIRDNLFKNKSYRGDFGDFVYLRALLFIFGIELARINYFSNSEIINNLGGQNGVIYIVDEFKNWQLAFERQWCTSNGVLGNSHCFTDEKAFSNSSTNVEIWEEQLESETDEKKKAQLLEKLNKERIKQSKRINPLDIYCMQIMDKIGDTVTEFSVKVSAQLKNTDLPHSDMFVIGQSLEVEPLSEKITHRSDGGYNLTSEYKNNSYMRGIFDNLLPDWFMGRNVDSPAQRKYFGAEDDKTIDNWLNKKSYWAYTESGNSISLKTSHPSDYTLFKPYLVLNNHLEDDPNNRRIIGQGVDKSGNVSPIFDPDYTFVSQCRARVNSAVPNLWESVRIKHLKPEYKAIYQEDQSDKFYGGLNEGIGFAGLVSAVMSCSGKDSEGNMLPAGEFNPVEDLGLSGQIADWVAQKMGYSSYKDYLFDFTPYGIFSPMDISECIGNSEYANNLSVRLNLYSKYGLSVSRSGDITHEENFEIEHTPIEVEEISVPNEINEPIQVENSFAKVDDIMTDEEAMAYARQQMSKPLNKNGVGLSDLDDESLVQIAELIASCTQGYDLLNNDDKEYVILGLVDFLRKVGA